jgi:steroid 5-alpha reductase family enzyme
MSIGPRLLFLISDVSGTCELFVGVLVSVWGLRLVWHMHMRNKGKAEDYRYFAWRNEWGKWFLLPFVFSSLYFARYFLIVMPVLLINKSINAELGMLGIFGVIVWFIGFYKELPWWCFSMSYPPPCIRGLTEYVSN